MIYYFSTFLFAGYLFFSGRLLEPVLTNIFKIKKSWRVFLLSVFLSFVMFSLLAGVAVVFFNLSTISVLVILGVNLLLSFVLSLWAKGVGILDEAPVTVLSSTVVEKINLKEIILALGYLFIAAYGFFLLWSSKTGAEITTPWQTIDGRFIYIFALSTFILGLLLVLRTSSSLMLGLFMVHSLLVYSYLPLTHEMIYGGDGWRHIATEERLLSGEAVIQPDIVGPKNELSFFIGKMAYGQLWGSSVAISRITSFSLFDINKWLMPVLWAIFLPVLLFEIGRSLGWSKRFSLLFVLLGFLPFTWQAGGAFTLPVNLGFITWLFMLLLIFHRASNPQPEQIYALALFGVLSAFGYTLFTILFWLSWIIYEFISIQSYFTWKEVLIVILIMAFSFPLLEWFLGYGKLLPEGSVMESIKQFAGNFSSYYLASGPRNHDILTGNVILNQTPDYAFVGNLFTSFRWWLFGFMSGMCLLVFYGFWVALKKGFGTLPELSESTEEKKLRNIFCLFVVLSAGLFLAYFIGRYWVPGEHVLTRRLDAVLAFLFLTLLIIGASHIPARVRKTPVVVVAFLLLSSGIAASYSLGPDTDVTSVDEVAAMNYIWEKEAESDKHCVIADINPLLSLEARSNKEIVGGGFPITNNFEQVELADILNRKNRDVSIIDAIKAMDTTKADRCWIVVPSDINISYFIKQRASSTNFGSVDVWEYR